MNDSTWTWVSGTNTLNHRGIFGEKGIPSVNNVPSSRSHAVGWYDSVKQELWLFGGFGYSSEGFYGMCRY